MPIIKSVNKMESVNEVELSRKLNTKGCCFLCLKTKNLENVMNCNQGIEFTSIQTLLRHLKIQDQPLNGKSLLGQNFKNDDIQVGLCENCGQMISRLSVLFQKLEEIQLEMDYLLEMIHKRISQSAKAPDRVQNYSKRMTSDLVALSQLAFVDNLRKEVSKKFSKKLNVPRLQVILTMSNMKIVKAKNTVPISESNGGDFPEQIDNPVEISFPDLLSSAPPSPIAIEVYEEKVKYSEASVSTKNEELSPSLKPPIKQNTKKSKYYTKNQFTGMFECNKCHKIWKSAVTVAQHFKRIHLKIRYKCDICNVSVFSKPCRLSVHKKACRQNLEKKLSKEKDPKFKFVCKICEKRFDESSKLWVHTKRVHENANRYKCDLCDKKYTTMTTLKGHHAAVHQSRKLYCKGCNKMYKYRDKLQKHEKKCVNIAKIKLESVQIQ